MGCSFLQVRERNDGLCFLCFIRKRSEPRETEAEGQESVMLLEWPKHLLLTTVSRRFGGERQHQDDIN